MGFVSDSNKAWAKTRLNILSGPSRITPICRHASGLFVEKTFQRIFWAMNFLGAFSGHLSPRKRGEHPAAKICEQIQRLKMKNRENFSQKKPLHNALVGTPSLQVLQPEHLEAPIFWQWNHV